MKSLESIPPCMPLRDYLLDREAPRAKLSSEESVFVVTSRRLLEYREWESPSTEDNAEWMRDLAVDVVVAVEVSSEPRSGVGAGGRLLESVGLIEVEDEVEASIQVFVDTGADAEPVWRVAVDDANSMEDVRGFVRALRKAAFTTRQEM